MKKNLTETPQHASPKQIHKYISGKHCHGNSPLKQFRFFLLSLCLQKEAILFGGNSVIIVPSWGL